jgi:hypothetical protein
VPLGPEHHEGDFGAWTASIGHIRSTPGFRPDAWNGDPWPYPMTAAENLADLKRHAAEFERGEAFAYTVLDPRTREVIGCVYVNQDHVADARCRLWVRANDAHLDHELAETVRSWLLGPDWAFSVVRFPGRE